MRDKWGAQPLTDSIPEHTIDRITIHHSGVVFTGDKSSEQYLSDLQSWSRSEKGWIDIPYHYLIDLAGGVYQGRPERFPGDTNTEYDPTGHLLISVIGNYQEQEFTAVQYESLVKLLVYLCRLHQVEPQMIKAHKDYTETVCPGKNIYTHLQDGSLIKKVQNSIKKISIE